MPKPQTPDDNASRQFGAELRAKRRVNAFTVPILTTRGLTAIAAASPPGGRPLSGRDAPAARDG